MRKILALFTNKPQTIIIAILLIIGVSFITREYYRSTYPGIYTTYDTGSYYSLAYGISLFPKEFFNHFRTPFYPLVLISCFHSDGLARDLLKNPSPEGMQCTVMIQQLVAIISSVVLFLTLFFTIRRVVLAFALSLIIAIHPLILPWERAILTESLSISWIVLFFVISLLLFKKKTVLYSLLFLLMSFIGILLRPSFLPLPIVATVIIFFPPVSKKSLQNTIALLFFFIIGVMFYILGNYRVQGIKTFQLVSSFNIIGRFLSHDIPINNNFSDRLKDQLIYHKKVSEEQQPYAFMYFDNSGYVTDVPYLISIESFARKLLLANLWNYIKTIPPDMPKAINSISHETIEFQQKYAGSKIIGFVQEIAKFVTILQYIAVLFYPIIVMKIKTSKDLQFIGRFSFVCIVTSFLFNMFFSYIDYQRLMVSNLPLLCVYTAWMIATVKYVKNIPTIST